MDLNKLTRQFILNEQQESPSIFSYIQVLSEILNSLRPMTLKEKHKIDVAKQHLNEIRKQGRHLSEQIKVLEEQIQILEEKKGKRK